MSTRTLSSLVVAGLLTVGLVAPPAAAATPSSARLAGPVGAATAAPTGPSLATAVKAASSSVSWKKKKHKSVEKHVLKLVNAERKDAGRKKLKRSSKIVKVARSWSVKQARRGKLAHNPSYASQLPGRWTRASENVAWIGSNASAKKLARRVVAMWLASPGHRANILDPKVTKTGIGVARSKQHGWYFTQNFSN